MIRIAAAYGDLLNLYGDYANVSVLARYLRSSGFLVETDSFSVGEYLNLSAYDMLYIGAGTERRMLYALDDFKRYFSELRLFAEKKGGFVLATGNAAALLGKTVTDFNGVVRAGAGLLDMDVVIQQKRVYRELVLISELLDVPVIGSINSSLSVECREQPFFKVSRQSAAGAKTEGARKGNVFATELSGPLFVRNPSLLHSFAELVSDKKIPKNDEDWTAWADMGYRRVLNSFGRGAGRRR